MTDGASAGPFAAWFWRRFRGQFFLAIVLYAVLIALVTVIVPAAVFAAIVVELAIPEALVLFAMALTITTLGILLAFTMRWDDKAVVEAWIRGDRSEPTEVWQVSLDIARQLTRRGVLLQLPGHLLVTGPAIAVIADLDWKELFAAELCFVGAELAGALAIGVGFHLLIRPLQDEVEPLLPLGSAPRQPGWSVRGRLLFGIGTGSFCVAMLSFLGTALVDSRASQFALTSLFAMAMSGYLVFLSRLGLVDPMLRPLHDLIDATARVRRGDYSTRVPISTADEFSGLLSGFNEMQRGLTEREALHSAFGSYVDPALARRLIESGSALFEGEDLDVTVLFADVRDFTSYAERVEPADAVARLNQLFDVMVPVIHQHGGHANHYLGDGLLAVFGAPQPLAGHADAAVRAAVEIQQQVLAQFGTGLRIGIGINTGPVIAGTVGGGGRHEFTVIGDTVNVAARVEQLTKDTGDSILVTEATRVALATPRPRSAKRGGFDLKGKSAKVTVHAVNPFPAVRREPRTAGIEGEM